MTDAVPANARRWPVQKRSRERLERVLRVAESLIVERGFANLNMREVAEIAKVNISTIYAYFPNSQALLRVLALQYITEIQANAESRFGSVANSNLTPEQMVDAYIDRLIDFYHSNPSWNSIWRGMQSDNELLALDIEDTRKLSPQIAAMLEKINPSLSDDMKLTAMILTSINGAVIRLASELSVREREATYHQLRQLARRMLIF